ncbi:MAG TPA: hypothetical protein VFB92_12375 [Vicinamibacterales bacterium]|nr:hypothetical protein [Vicinamibacterales bacterium]
MKMPRPSANRRITMLLSVVMLAGCGGSQDVSMTQTERGGSDDAVLADRYGFGPRPDPSITYQPDVILIEGGPKVIRGVSADGLTWSIDAKATGVDRLKPGTIMFATSQAVGRVVRLAAKPDVLDVTLSPVELGDVIRDGRLVVDQVVPVESLSFFEAPQIVDGYEDIPSNQLVQAALAIDRPIIGYSRAIALLNAPANIRDVDDMSSSAAPGDVDEKSTKVGDWSLTAYKKTGVMGLRADRGLAGAKTVGAGKTITGADLMVALDAHLEVSGLRVVADIPVTRGEVGTSHFRVYGIDGLVMSVQAGSVNGLSDNRKARIEFPIQLRQNVIIGGFPATLTQKFKFLVQTAFTAKNGNLSASGEWDVAGSIGIDGQTVTLPTVTTRGTKLIDSIMGVSVGVNGIVVGVSFEFSLVFGLPVAGAGPAASFITSLGLTNGSSLGIVQCKQVSITSVVTGGVSIQMFDPIKQAMKKVLGVDIPAERPLVSKNVLQENWVKPNVLACK